MTRSLYIILPLLLPFLELHFPISIIHTLSLAFLSLHSYSKRSQKHQPNKNLILSQLLCSSIDPQASQCPGFLCSRYHMVHGSTLGTSWRFCTVGPWGKQRDGDYSRIQGRQNISNGRSTFCLSLQSSTAMGSAQTFREDRCSNWYPSKGNNKWRDSHLASKNTGHSGCREDFVGSAIVHFVMGRSLVSFAVYPRQWGFVLLKQNIRWNTVDQN